MIHELGKWLACVVLTLAALLWPRDARAHELSIDQLSLSIDSKQNKLSGQILFDPELTRRTDEPPSPEAEQRVLQFLRQNLKLEADGRALTPSYSVRELWVTGGATQGDLVLVDVSVPEKARTLRVHVGEPLKALVVSVRRPASDGSWSTHSTLTFGGNWTDPYHLDGFAPKAWREGGAEQFSLDAGAPNAPAAPSATSRGPTAPRPEAQGRSARDNGWQQARRYLALGVLHILPRGFDHVLFVAGLVLASRRIKALLLQLTAFTLAHSLTLALGALNLVVLPRVIVEPLIALSISFVAIENLLRRGDSKYRPLVVFLFGLLHGQGFAGVLADLELPRGSFLVALVSFNLGVEIGQLLVVALVLVALYPIKDEALYRKYALVPGSLLTAAMGIYWFVERLSS